jgi:hypothetical protein
MAGWHPPYNYDPDDGSIANLGDNGTSMQFARRITDPGLYYITVVDNETIDNVTKVLHADTIAVMVDNRTALDTKLQSKWSGAKAGFAEADVEKSLKKFSSLSTDKYREIFTVISSRLPDIAADMQNIQLIIVDDKTAKYRIRRVETINGQTLPITYYIYFIKDIDGLWKIEKW